jgi:dihydroxyacetone kinase
VIKELDSIVLNKDLPDLGLEAGDVGTVVLVHAGGAGFEVEFATLVGETLTVATLTGSAIRPIDRHEIAHVRRVAHG